jgi:hypothetical protein
LSPDEKEIMQNIIKNAKKWNWFQL